MTQTNFYKISTISDEFLIEDLESEFKILGHNDTEDTQNTIYQNFRLYFSRRGSYKIEKIDIDILNSLLVKNSLES